MHDLIPKAHPAVVDSEAALLGRVPVGGVAGHDLLGQAVRCRHAHGVVGHVQLRGVQVLPEASPQAPQPGQHKPQMRTASCHT